MDEKGTRLACPTGQEIVVPVGIKEIYVGIPENRISLTVIECICANGTAIPPVIIVPGIMIMGSWFHEKMTGHEVITVSPTGYTNEGICMAWLDHFIKHYNCGPDSHWRILLINGATCHNTGDFIIKAKMNKIWVIKYPSHQTHLLQPLDVGCFREWKQYQNGNVWNSVRGFEAEYNLCSFFRDLPKLRIKTFTKRTIKHSFKNSGMWPLSFTQVKRKIKEYGKKNKKDLGLEFLEFAGDPDSEDSDDQEEGVDQSDPIPDPALDQEYQLPPLPKPASYSDCVFQFKALDSKIEDVLSSPSRRKYQVVRQSTDEWLMRGSLHAQQLLNAANAQVELHKSKLDARISLGKGGNMLAIDGLEKKKMLKRKAADAAVTKQKTKIRKYENKAKRLCHEAGVKARREEKERLRFLSNNQGILGAYIPIASQEPIRDPEKDPLPEEIETVRIGGLGLYEELVRLEKEAERVKSDDPEVFTTIPIDPEILEIEQKFKLAQRKGISEVIVGDEEDLDDSDKEGSDSEGSLVRDDDIVSSPPRSVASIDSI